ncbi:MAG TPA: hypothetical protein ENN69_08930 [Spirochaetia bacterium]|nr:hypothetical protein [Spirochaetia bacterium]
MKTYSRIEEINHQLVRRNRELAQRLSEETDDPHVAQELWIILDKVHKGLDLISSGGVGTLNRRQSTLLEITQGNIDNLYLLIDRRGTPIRQIPTPRRRRTDGIDERERLNCGSNVPSIQPGQ